MEKETLFIAFSTQKGGAGKTTLTVLVASYLHYVKGMNVAVRVAVNGEAASEEERLQAGKTLAELRNTPMFEQLTSGDAEREERIGSLIELHLAAYRKRKQPDSEPAAETIPDTFSISDIV